MKFIMRLDNVKYKKERIIEIFKSVGVEDEDFFELITTRKRIVYVRYENHTDFFVWTAKNIKDIEEGLKTFNRSVLGERRYNVLKYTDYGLTYIGVIQ